MGKNVCEYRHRTDDMGSYYCSVYKAEGNDEGFGEDLCCYCDFVDDEEFYEDDDNEEVDDE